MTSVGAHGDAICAAVDCTDRQLDYWARCGVFGPDRAVPVGSGSRRDWSGTAEAAYAVARLSEMGARTEHTTRAAAVVMARPVIDGELLIVSAPPLVTAERFMPETVRTPDGPVWLVPLRTEAALNVCVDRRATNSHPVAPGRFAGPSPAPTPLATDPSRWRTTGPGRVGATP